MKHAYIFAVALLAGCTASQQAAIDAAIAKNADAVTAACMEPLTIAYDPATNAFAAVVPVVAQIQAAIKVGCGTADGLAAMAKSASTVDWLATATTVMKSGGTVLPTPVAPAPIAGS